MSTLLECVVVNVGGWVVRKKLKKIDISDFEQMAMANHPSPRKRNTPQRGLIEIVWTNMYSDNAEVFQMLLSVVKMCQRDRGE